MLGFSSPSWEIIFYAHTDDDNDGQGVEKVDYFDGGSVNDANNNVDFNDDERTLQGEQWWWWR